MKKNVKLPEFEKSADVERLKDNANSALKKANERLTQIVDKLKGECDDSNKATNILLLAKTSRS